MAVTQIPVTVKGLAQLKAELLRLRSVDRPYIIQAIAEARAQGDLSENAEYEAAKERQSFIEGRINEVEAKLSNAMVIDPSTLHADGRCVFGSTVRIEDLDSGNIITYQIVGEDEADIKNGKISISSPIARGLIGKSEGDIAEVVAPGGIKEYEVLDVQYI
jgi:transcription elongation factor GreA